MLHRMRPWLALGAGMGLVIGFSTRWYWGLVAATLLSLVLAATYLVGPRWERPGGRMHFKRRRT